MSNTKTVFILLSLLLLLFQGCSRRHVSVGRGTGESLSPARYKKALKHYTQSASVYSNFETVLLAKATYWGWSFRDAYADEYGYRYVLPAAAQSEMEARERSDWEMYHQFMLAAYTPNPKKNDFSKPDSIWRLRLYDSSGNVAAPVVIKRVDHDDETLKEFFPYVDGWYRAYVVKFPREELELGSEQLVLQAASALGIAEFTYATHKEPVPEEKGHMDASLQSQE